LDNLSNRHADLGRREDALAASDEAVSIYRQLVDARPDASLPDLARALNNLFNSLADLGRREDASAAIDEAVRIYRQLVDARPDAFLPDLASALDNLSNGLAHLGRPEDAFAAADEAVRSMLPRLEQAPYLLPDTGLHLVQRYIAACEALSRTPDTDIVERFYIVLRAAGVIGDDGADTA
jgi:tetratricopeptide (TPR) repeat protein